MLRFLRRLAARPWLTAAGVAILVAAGVGGYWITRDGGSASAQTTTRMVSATLGTVRQSVSATGTIEPAVQSSVSFQVSGKVTSVRVAEDQPVKAGAVLATIDSASLQANLAQAKASLATAQAKLSSDTDAGAGATALAADTASVTSAHNEVASAQTSLSEATLTSPVAGVVATVDLTVGQQVGGSSAGSNSNGSGSSGSGTGTGAGAANSTSSAASSSSSSGQFLVISTSSWIVNASVDSTSIGLIADGNQVQILPGSGSQTVYGTIASIGILSSGSSSGVATYPVVVDVTGDPAGMHAGDSATLSMIYKQISNVLTVPTLAVHTGNGKSFVYEMSNGRQVQKPVTVGVSSGGTTQITSGLSEGDQVVVQVAARVGTAPSGSTRSGSTRTGGGGFGGGGFGGTGGFGGGSAARSGGG